MRRPHIGANRLHLRPPASEAPLNTNPPYASTRIKWKLFNRPQTIAAGIRIIDAPGESLNSVKQYNPRAKEDRMEKEQLERLLRDHANVADVGPIEDYLDAIATEPAIPDFAMARCTVRIEESAPYLRAVLVRAADGEVLSEEASTLLFRGLHILGAARDTEACRPLLRLLRRPSDEVDYLLGDAITENLGKIVVGVFDGDVDTLYALIVDLTIDEFIREALLGAVTFLAWEGRVDRDRLLQFLKRFYDERLAADSDYSWYGWMQAIALLGLRHMVPLVDRAWRDGRIDTEFLDRRDFDQDLAEAERAPGELDRFTRVNLGYIDDVLASLDWVSRGEDNGEENDDASSWTDIAAEPTEPIRNPWRHVGRNDPCPCGSGKKAKKCCLSGGQPPL